MHKATCAFSLCLDILYFVRMLLWISLITLLTHENTILTTRNAVLVCPKLQIVFQLNVKMTCHITSASMLMLSLILTMLLLIVRHVIVTY